MESSKYVGPIPTPVNGTLVTVNQAVQDKPNLLVDDPYGQGWVAELTVPDWDTQKEELATGQAALDGYKAFMDKEDFSCD
jgi:glycine cleavage system H protein